MAVKSTFMVDAEPPLRNMKTGRLELYYIVQFSPTFSQYKFGTSCQSCILSFGIIDFLALLAKFQYYRFWNLVPALAYELQAFPLRHHQTIHYINAFVRQHSGTNCSAPLSVSSYLFRRPDIALQLRLSPENPTGLLRCSSHLTRPQSKWKEMFTGIAPRFLSQTDL